MKKIISYFEERRLIAQFRKGDKAAFDTLYQTYAPRVLAFSLTLAQGSWADAEDLTQDGGGALVSVHDWQQLGKLLQDLWRDRPRLTKLVEQAAAKRTRFNDEAVFQERSQLIKLYLS